MTSAAKTRAKNKSKADAWVFGLDRATYEGFMTFAQDRSLRKLMFDGYRARGANENSTDNQELVLKIAQLRAKRAELLGYKTHAHYQLETRMAKTPETVVSFLSKIWEAGLDKASKEEAEMQAIMDAHGIGAAIEGRDWWFYAEKLRGQKYAFDESQVKPYFELSSVLQGAFYTAGKLFSLTFTELNDVPVWHPEVKAFEVKSANDEHLGVFLSIFTVETPSVAAYG